MFANINLSSHMNFKRYNLQKLCYYHQSLNRNVLKHGQVWSGLVSFGWFHFVGLVWSGLVSMDFFHWSDIFCVSFSLFCFKLYITNFM